MEDQNTSQTSWARLLVTVLVIGSLWGFSEVVVGSAIRAAGLPFRAGILTGIGMGLMAVALGASRRPALLPGIAMVTALCHQLAVPILHVSFMCRANSALAVLLEGAALTGVAFLAGRRLAKGIPIQAASGATAALLAAGAFYFVGLRVAPCQYLLSFARSGGLLAFMLAEGLVWAAFSAALVPVGYWAGARLDRAVQTASLKKPARYYLTSAAIIVFCWAASAAVIAAGG